MSNTNNGGHAFPCLELGIHGIDLTDGGITLRDYFAAKAMQSLIAIDHGSDFEIATDAYKMADAMMGARNK